MLDNVSGMQWEKWQLNELACINSSLFPFTYKQKSGPTVESPVVCDTENGRNSRNSGRTQNSQNFMEIAILMRKRKSNTENTVKKE